MPGNRRRRALELLSLTGLTQATLLFTATTAAAEPEPAPSRSSDPCDLLIGQAKDYCESGDGGGSRRAPTDPLSDTLDPLSSLARGCAKAAAWTVDNLSKAVEKTSDVDFTNQAFLTQYAVVFAASTVLTLVLWLLAVAKRAVRGVPLTEAIGEAVGFLWLTVLASAFTPLVLHTVVSATDAVTEAVASGMSPNYDKFFGAFSAALSMKAEGRVRVFSNSETRSSRELGGASGGYGYTNRVPLKGLEPGLYVLTVEARSTLKGTATASRDVQIRIVP